MAESYGGILLMALATTTFLGTATALEPNNTLLCYRCYDSHGDVYNDKSDPKCVSGMMDDSYLTQQEGDPPGLLPARKNAKQGSEREVCETFHTINRETKKTLSIIRRKVKWDESLGCRKDGDMFSTADICTCNTDKCNKDPIKPSSGTSGVSRRRVTAALMILTSFSTFLLNNHHTAEAA